MAPSKADAARLLACQECGTVHRIRAVPAGGVALCSTCDGELYRGRRESLEAAVALNLTALILFAIAHLFPFMTLRLEGQSQTVTLLSGCLMLWRQGMWPLALLVFVVASLVPGLRLIGALYALMPLWWGRRPRYGAIAYRLVELLHPWAMMEVYLLGVIVAYVKLSDLATINPDLALYAFVALILVMVTAEAVVEPHEVWERYGRQARADLLGAAAARPLACRGCGQLLPATAAGDRHHTKCPRCRARVFRRKPDSVGRTWALVIAAAVLYVPANILPIMSVIYFARGQPDTIMSGVRALLEAGMYPVALLVFFASITVPVLKIWGLVWLLLGIRQKVTSAPRLRTLAYRVIEGVGRWSMIDIFMISILVALVNLGAVATIEPGPGALCFAAVVVLTMLASASFDARLIWDIREEKGERDAPLRV